MTANDFYELLATLEIPVAYHTFKTEQELPYLIYIFDKSNDFSADDEHYFKVRTGYIEIYSKDADSNLSSRLIKILEENKIEYSRYEESYIPEEEMFMALFYFEHNFKEEV